MVLPAANYSKTPAWLKLQGASAELIPVFKVYAL
jgi:hypothetical protein